MASIGAMRPRADPVARPSHGTSLLCQALLACGVLSSLVYAATDLLGGLAYPGYHFTSQAISELGAIGSPVGPLVDPLFVLYDVLALAFGAGLVWEGVRRRSRPLRLAGLTVILYGALGAFAASGLADPTHFKMHARGTGSLGADAPHIILTAVLVVLLLLTMGAGARAFGARFRRYSVATIAVVLLFGALTSPLATRLAAGEPTPGLGLIERLDVYAAMFWLAVLSIALLRPPRQAAGGIHP